MTVNKRTKKIIFILIAMIIVAIGCVAFVNKKNKTNMYKKYEYQAGPVAPRMYPVGVGLSYLEYEKNKEWNSGQDIGNENHYRNIFSQYQHFGLLFLNVGMKTEKDNLQTRQVNIHNQDTEDIALIEEVVYDREENGMEQYHIQGKAMSEEISLSHYEGKIYRKPKEYGIEEVSLSLKYKKGDITSEWAFNICRTN